LWLASLVLALVVVEAPVIELLVSARKGSVSVHKKTKRRVSTSDNIMTNNKNKKDAHSTTQERKYKLSTVDTENVFLLEILLRTLLNVNICEKTCLYEPQAIGR
jgi:hypothetical protein